MTFSIVGRDEAGTALGVAVASKFLAVGAAVPAAEAQVGAVATQAMANLRYRPDGLVLLREGKPASTVVAALTRDDEQREHRQVGVVDAEGGSGSFTGSECIGWAGHRTGPGYAIQGNCLVGPDVVAAAEAAWCAARAPSLARRLLSALGAGDAAGGDRRGRQSAALLVVAPGAGYGGGSDVLVDLRVDDHPTPVAELDRLLTLHGLYFGKPDPESLLALDENLRSEVAGHLTRLGHDPGADFDRAYETWIGTENYEERHVAGFIDPVVLERLRAQERT
ncbi:MAG TPA: DUF1028 domain-containing protein [Mycobacteriales bacterium]|nr:DUF1028 domain-containing protein [Mycobacteriales bacterium]